MFIYVESIFRWADFWDRFSMYLLMILQIIIYALDHTTIVSIGFNRYLRNEIMELSRATVVENLISLINVMYRCYVKNQLTKSEMIIL